MENELVFFDKEEFREILKERIKTKKEYKNCYSISFDFSEEHRRIFCRSSRIYHILKKLKTLWDIDYSNFLGTKYYYFNVDISYKKGNEIKYKILKGKFKAHTINEGIIRYLRKIRYSSDAKKRALIRYSDLIDSIFEYEFYNARNKHEKNIDKWAKELLSSEIRLE